MKNYFFWSLLFALLIVASCKNSSKTTSAAEKRKQDSIERVKKAQEEAERAERERPRTAADIKLEKDLQYDKHSLEETYPYKDTTRQFQIEKIKEKLAFIENFQRAPHQYGEIGRASCRERGRR